MRFHYPELRDKQEERYMLKLMFVICICLVTLPIVCESVSKYQLATIIEVTPHQPETDKAHDVTSYDVSVKVADTIYLVQYTDRLSTGTVKYAAGRELLVMVDKKALRYNDILGQSFEVPIVSQKPAASAKQAK